MGMSDRSVTQAQGAITGCLVGAGIGLLIKLSPTAGVLGCMAGGLAGYAYGDHVAGKKAAYKSQEEYLSAVIAQSTKVRDETHAVTLQLKQEIALMKTQNANKKQTLNSATTNAVNLNQQKVHREKLLASSKTAMENVDREIEIQKKVIKDEAKASKPQTIMLASIRVGELEQEQKALKVALAQIASTNIRQEP